jgi:hypothetical protein
MKRVERERRRLGVFVTQYRQPVVLCPRREDPAARNQSSAVPGQQQGAGVAARATVADVEIRRLVTEGARPGDQGLQVDTETISIVCGGLTCPDLKPFAIGRCAI